MQVDAFVCSEHRLGVEVLNARIWLTRDQLDNFWKRTPGTGRNLSDRNTIANGYLLDQRIMILI